MLESDDLISLIEAEGVGVFYTHLKRVCGGYDTDSQRVWIDYAVARNSILFRCTLAHEYIHVLRGDNGPQPSLVEQYCDRNAMKMLISDVEYEQAELVTGGNVWDLAQELGVTVDYVRLYQEVRWGVKLS